jgi:hypothetical protein
MRVAMRYAACANGLLIAPPTVEEVEDVRAGVDRHPSCARGKQQQQQLPTLWHMPRSYDPKPRRGDLKLKAPACVSL